MTATGGKSISFTNANSAINSFNNSAAKSINLNMREKGYDALREKKIIEKYP
jgi:hypothetical protein